MKLFCTFYSEGWRIGQADSIRNDGYPYLGWETGDTKYTWYIYGEGTWATHGASFSFPDLMDDKGRRIKNAVIKAYRTDSHSLITDPKYTDHNGTVSFGELPIGQDIVFHATWGGATGTEHEEWFFLRVNDIEDGGTGSGTAEGALDNLGIHDAETKWTILLGD